MAIAASLHAQTGGWAGSEVRSHDRRPAAQKREGVGLHPRITHRKQFRDAAFALLDQHRDRVGPVRWRLPLGLRIEWHLTPPVGALRPPLVKLLRCVPLIRRSIHDVLGSRSLSVIGSI